MASKKGSSKKGLPYAGKSRGEILKSEIKRRTIGEPDKGFAGKSRLDIFKADLYKRIFGSGSSGSGASGSLGTAGKAVSKGATKGKGNVSNVAVPSMETPQTASNINNPSIATITDQLNQLVNTANMIGILTREQQELLLNQISQADRVSQESQLEAKDIESIIPESPEPGLTSEALVPITDAMESLSRKIDGLIGVINDKMDDCDDSSAMGGNADGEDIDLDRKRRGRGRGGRRGRVARRGFRPERTRGGGTRYRNVATGRFASAAEATRRAGLLGNVADLARVGGRRLMATGAAQTAGTAITALSSTRIAQMIGNGFRMAGSRVATQVMGRPVLAQTVRRAAMPILQKGLGRTVAKSIPIVGAVVGAGFAINRLLQGDVVGAGIDLMSGLGGPLTAIPAFVASVSRDVYSDVFGVQPEQDPEFGTRIGMITDIVQDLVKELLGQAVKVQSPPPASEAARAQIPTQQFTQRPDQQVTPQSPPTNLPPATPETPPSSSGQTMTSDAAPTSTPEPSKAASGQQLQVAEQQPSGTLYGDFINAQSVPVREEWQDYGYDSAREMFVPQTGSTPRGGAEGIGRIPDPVYRATNIEALKSTLYFNYS